MTSINRKFENNTGDDNGYKIPSSIVSLPARLQKKIQKETDCELKTTEQQQQSLNENKSSDKYKRNDRGKYEIMGVVQQQPKGNKILLHNEKYEKGGRVGIMQFPQRQCNPRQERKDIEDDENAKSTTSSSGTTSNLESTYLVKERSQHYLNDPLNNTAYSSLHKRGNSYRTELPSWFRNSQLFENNDYWNKKFDNVALLNDKYFDLLNSDSEILLMENWSLITNYRIEMNEIFGFILENHLKFCSKENVEMYFWKILYYNLIEKLRRHMYNLQQQQQQQQQQNHHRHHHPSNSYTTLLIIKDIKLKSLQLIDNGIQFYEIKLKFLEEKYLKSSTINTTISQKYEMLANILLQKILIHLGDLFRYKEQMDDNYNNNYNDAKQYYQKAQKLIPSNGIPYNQLAIISIYNKKTFDSIYYFMRSLCASNPIHSAKESLKELFEEIRKKYENEHQQKQNTQQQQQQKQKQDLKQHFGKKLLTLEETDNFSSLSLDEGAKNLNLPLKKEIWIHPNGSKRLHRFGSVTSNIIKYCYKENQFNKINSDELLKRFTTNYLYILGKLFTGIGMETFTKILHDMLAEFKMILCRNPLIITDNRLLQIISLNIFVIEYNYKKDKQNDVNIENGKEIFNHSFNTGSLIFGCILKRLNEILQELFAIENYTSDSYNDDNFNEELHTTFSNNGVLKLSTASDNKSAIGKGSNYKENKGIKSHHCKKQLYYNDITENAKILLQAVKIWCNWLKININMWNPSKLSLNNYNFLNYYDINPWNGLAQLVTLLSCVNFELKVNDDDLINTKLREDIFLNGFQPLYTNKSSSITIDNNLLKNQEISANLKTDEDHEKLEMIKRLKEIKEFGLKTLCECEPAIFEKICNAEGTTIYVKNIMKINDEIEIDELESFEKFIEDDALLIDENEEDVITTTNNANVGATGNSKIIASANLTTPNEKQENKPSDSNDVDVLKLIQRKHELEQKTKQHEFYQKKLENILKFSDIIFHIEVRPKYLIPDTNCFIDCLHLLKIIASINNNTKRYQLLIPIVVCNELEGLSKGFKLSNLTTLQATSSTIRHFDEVTIRARDALEFIKSHRKQQPQSAGGVAALTAGTTIKYVTTKGSILNTKNFILEENDDDYGTDEFSNSIAIGNGIGGIGSNDDKILQTAVNLCNRTNIERKLKDKIFVQTEVVLFTTDRNLRVKALSRNLSVSQLKEFITWANLYEN